MKKYIVKLERFPQHDFIERHGIGFTKEDAVRAVLDKYFAQNKTQKIRLAGCIEIIDTRP